MSRSQVAIAAAVAALIAGCGGGGSDDTPAQGPVAQGVYEGTLTGSTSSAFTMLMLENGEYWALYGDRVSSTFRVSGFVQGTGTSNDGSFASSNAKDFGFSPARAGSLNATYNNSARTISGSVSSSSGSVSFSGGPVAGSTYNYDTPASLSTIAGNWSLTSLSGESVSLSVASGGAITASSSAGCHMTGNVAPRPTGKNVFNVTLTFGPSPCALAGQSAAGIAVAYPLSSGATQFIFAGTDSTRTHGTVAFGTR